MNDVLSVVAKYPTTAGWLSACFVVAVSPAGRLVADLWPSLFVL